MRLLHRKNDEEFSIAEFSGKNIPPYAILSHTWGADNEEVTFRDVVEGSGSSKAGYQKIRFCGEQAARDDLRYFWVDTCCIDKSSSAELAEAINSMFRWYKDSDKCYAYLSDVSVSDGEPSRLAWESAFQKSRWFTRAWTLQELIAPKSIEFFSAEGRRLGDKKSLQQKIGDITGVSLQALQGTPLFHFSIDERMSWAAKREAKREEDEAYSLLGVFDVQMPLLYGEKKAKAFIRLQEEIDKSLKRQNKMFDLMHQGRVDPDQEPSTGNVHWKVPRMINTLFTGRAKLLESIESAVLKDILELKILVITGMGGLGKSEICLRVVNDMRREFWGVFWVDVSKPEIAKTEFLSIAKLLGKEVRSVQEACMLLSNTKKACLLILDNANDPNFDYNVYLPSGMQGSVIITSRVADCKQYSTVLSEALASLDPEDSQALLLKAAHIPEEHWAANVEAAGSIVRLLGSHTLAIIQAGAYVARRHGNLQDYPKTFQQQRRRLLEFRPLQAKSRYSDVYATFEASTEVLSDDALQLLSIVSMLHDSFLPMSIFEKAWVGSKRVTSGKSESSPKLGGISSWEVSQLFGLTDMSGNETGLDVLDEWHVSQLPTFIGAKNHQWHPYRLEEAVSLLQSLSLVRVAEQNGLRGVSMHPLAHAWAKDRLEPEAKTHNWIAAGSVITLSLRGSTSREDIEQHLQPHVQSYIDEKFESCIICGLQRNMLALAWSCSWMLVQMRDEARLERLLEESFREADLDPTQVQSSWVPLYHLLAYSHGFNRHWGMALDLMEQIVEIHRENLAEASPNGIAAQHMLARTYLESSQNDEAIKLLEQALELSTATGHSGSLSLQQELAIAYRENEQVAEAVKLLEHEVKIRKATQAETHQHRLRSQYELAIAYLENDQIKEALKLHEHVLKIRTTMLAETNPSQLASQCELARAYLRDRQIEEAIKLLEHVVRIEATTLAETSSSRLNSQHQLARAYLKDRQIEEAIKLLEHVVRIEATMLAETNPGRLASEYELARAYLANKQIEEAINLFEHVATIEAATLAETDVGRLLTQHELARAYCESGEFEEGIKRFEHVVRIEVTTLAETDPIRLASQHELARAYLANKQIEEAVKLLEYIVKLEVTTLPKMDPNRLASQELLAEAIFLLLPHCY